MNGQLQPVEAAAGKLVTVAQAQASPNRTAPLQALCAIARLHQIAADPATLAHQLGLQASEPIGANELLRAAKHLGLKAKLSTTTVQRLALTPLPALAAVRRADGSIGYVILARCDARGSSFRTRPLKLPGPPSNPSKPSPHDGRVI